jgi:hypothetical protein
MLPSRLILFIVSLLLAGQAFAQTQPGDAAFCQSYAAAAANAAQDAIALNPACLDPSKGVHPVRKSHADWCSHTSAQEVEGAATHIARLASRCTQGALAAPTDYGGFEVAGTNEKFERPYGVARDWEVRAARSGSNTFMYCVAVSNKGGRQVRIGVDDTVMQRGQQWQLAIPLPSRKDWQGTLEVDGQGTGNGGGNNTSGNSVQGWTIAWLSMGDVDAMRQGQRAVLGVGNLDYDFSLEGAAAAILKVEECRSRRGVLVPARVAAAPARAAPAPAAGDMITPDVPGASQSCIGPRGGRWVAGADLVLHNCQPKTNNLFTRARGIVTVSNNTLCIVARGDRAPLELGGCGGGPDSTWTWAGSGTNPGPISSPDGRCWTIPALHNPNAVFPFPVVAVRCQGGARPSTKFFFSRN